MTVSFEFKGLPDRGTITLLPNVPTDASEDYTDDQIAVLARHLTYVVGDRCFGNLY
tara:strand:- start:140 stop:307 length:168 start_codon:yes stop_codon:yes gene_type:complete